MFHRNLSTYFTLTLGPERSLNLECSIPAEAVSVMQQTCCPATFREDGTEVGGLLKVAVLITVLGFWD